MITIKNQAIFLMLMSVVLVGCNVQMKNQGIHTQQQGTRILGQDQTQDHRIQIANQAADKITKINGVSRANILVTQKNAYVAAVLKNNQDQLSREIENQIADQVRATVPNIQNVYVSTNPNFIDRVNTYVNDVQKGKPVTGFFEEFNEMIQRVFPNAR